MRRHDREGNWIILAGHGAMMIPAYTMQTNIRFVSLAVAFFLTTNVAQGQSADSTLVLANVNVVDVRNGRVVPDQTVLISGNRIQAVQQSARVSVKTGMQVVDGRGKFLMPGLWDMHMVALNAVQRGEPTLALLIAHGVTGIRDVSSSMPPDTVRKLQQDINAGVVLGPRIIYSGRAIYYGLRRPGFSDNAHFGVTTAEEARKAVDSLALARVDFVKVYWLPRDILRAIIDRAKQHHIRVTGQIATGWKEASEAGIYAIEHITELYRGTSARRADFADYALLTGRWRSWRGREVPSEVTDSLLEQLRAAPDPVYRRQTLQTLAQNRTWVATALSNMTWARAQRELSDTSRIRFRSAEQQAALEKDLRRPFHLAQRDAILRDVHDMQRAGIRLVAGSVSGSVAVSTPGATIHDELFWLVQSGASPLEAIRTATLNPARFLNATDSMGTVERGKVADLLLLDGNPVADVENVARIHGVVLNGRYLGRARLDRLINEAHWAIRHQQRR